MAVFVLKFDNSRAKVDESKAQVIKPLVDSDIENCLKRLSTWDQFEAHPYGWQLFPGSDPVNIGLNQANKATQLRMNQGVVNWTRSPNAPADARFAIPVMVPMKMRNVLPDYLEICVACDGIGVIPDSMARVYASGFAGGVAAAFVFARVCQQLDISPPNISFDGSSGEAHLPDILTPLQKDELSGYQNYGIYRNITDPVEAYLERVRNYSESIPLEAQGLIWGWNDVCEAFRTNDVEKMKILADMVASRFSYYSLGQIFSHSLIYLQTFVLSSTISVASAGSTISLQALEAMADNDTKIRRDKIIESLEIVFDFFLGAAGKTSDPSVNRFIEGYNAGLIKSTWDVFYLSLQLGYAVGYRNGFSQGYTRGYHDGRVAGYARGFQAGLGNFLDDVVHIVDTVKGVTGDVAKVASVLAFL